MMFLICGVFESSLFNRRLIAFIDSWINYDVSDLRGFESSLFNRRPIAFIDSWINYDVSDSSLFKKCENSYGMSSNRHV
jgi:hypothetical protein